MTLDWITFEVNQSSPKLCTASTLHQQVINLFTSLIIIFWGLYGLYQLPSTALYPISYIWKSLYSKLIVSGIASMLFSSNTAFYTSPVIIIQWMYFYQIIQILLVLNLKNDRIIVTKYTIIIKSLHALLMLLCFISVILANAHPMSFGILFLAVSVMLLITIICAKYVEAPLNSTQFQLILRYVWTGFAVIFIASIIWIISESLCTHHTIIKDLPFHIVSKLLIGYGLYILIQFGVFFDFCINSETSSDIAGTKAKVYESGEIMIKTKSDGRTSLERAWFILVPVLFIRKAEKMQMSVKSKSNASVTAMSNEPIDIPITEMTFTSSMNSPNKPISPSPVDSTDIYID